MTAALPETVAKALEKHITRTMKNRLVNWGRWWRAGNELEIRRDTGQITQSPSGRLMQFGRVQTKSGYADQHREPIDEDDALALHHTITSGILTKGQASELRRFYCDSGEGGTNSQTVTRHNAVKRLCGLVEP